MTTVLIDYGSGNLHSAEKALRKAAQQLGNSQKIVVSSKPEDVFKADKIVLPGVGAFADCFQGLQSIDGMLEALNEHVRNQGKPFLGICVGMQMMFERGFEHGESLGLGWIAGDVKAIDDCNGQLKIPHMGWNNLIFHQAHPALNTLQTYANQDAYFVHSYCATLTEPQNLVASCEYGKNIAAIVAKDNMLGTQFHPEKSQNYGLLLLEGFLKWAP